MTLDERIKKDLTESFNGKELSGAKALSSLVEVSTFGLPQHFTGNRKAKTVFVMLNPGKDIEKANRQRKENTDAAKDFDRKDVDSFINSYINNLKNFGKKDRERLDNFDLKQAYFLKAWTNSGITFPDEFKKSEENKKDAKEAVISQKLQMELLPYCSSHFRINNPKIDLICEYVDTLFDEIFAQNRKYVIFGAGIFERVFKAYNKITKSNAIDLSEKKVSVPLKKMNGYSRPVTINWKGKQCRAIIAYTFPSQALPNAPDLMEKYGKFCFEQYTK